MGRLPLLVKYGSKLVLEILPSLAATVIGGYLLAQLHFARTAEPPAQPQPTATAAAPSTPEVPTVREDRAAMREVLKDRRENPEPPAVVRPSVAAAAAPAPAAPPAPVSTPAASPAAMDSIPPAEQAQHTAPPSRPIVAAAPPVVPRARPDSVASVYAPAPPPGLPQAPAIGAAAPLRVAPVTPAAPSAVGPVANPAPPVTAEAPAQRRGVLSTLSGFVGTAASATGNTVNWVIDLPGKAIEAGGRVIGVDPPPPNRPFS